MRLVAEVFRPQVSYLSADGRNCSSWPFSTRCKTASAPRLRVSSSSSSPPPISCLSCLSSSSPPAPSSGKAATHSSTVTGEWDLVLDNFKLRWGKQSNWIVSPAHWLQHTESVSFKHQKGKCSQSSLDFEALP